GGNPARQARPYLGDIRKAMRKLSRRQLIQNLGGAIGSATLFAAVRPPEKPARPVLRVRESADSVEIDNGLVKARFSRFAGGIDQEYSARRGDGKWIPLVKSLRPAQHGPEGSTPLYTDQHVPKEYRLLAAEAFQSLRVSRKTEKQTDVVLSGRLGADDIEQLVSLSTRLQNSILEVRVVLAG